MRARCRLQQQRVLLAWLMICKLRPAAFNPSTYVVKPLADAPALALPSPVFVTSVEPLEPPEALPKASEPLAAAAAAAYVDAASPGRSPGRFRVTMSPSRERHALACKAATNDGDYRQLLEHHRLGRPSLP